MKKSKRLRFKNGEPLRFELPDGVYNLEQIKAPDGYELEQNSYSVYCK